MRTREQESKGKRQQQQITGWIILSPSRVGRLSFVSLHKLGNWWEGNEARILWRGETRLQFGAYRV